MSAKLSREHLGAALGKSADWVQDIEEDKKEPTPKESALWLHVVDVQLRKGRS